MTRDERFIIENAAESDDLDLLLAAHRCIDCGAPAFLEVGVADGRDDVARWFCQNCADAVERDVEAAAETSLLGSRAA